jgi:hypothetical protein
MHLADSCGFSKCIFFLGGLEFMRVVEFCGELNFAGGLEISSPAFSYIIRGFLKDLQKKHSDNR